MLAPYNPSVKLTNESTFDASSLQGKSVVITGGASGLGEQFAQSFVSAGAFVTIGDINSEGGRRVVEALGGEGKAAFSKCDVLSWDDQVKLFKAAMERSPSKSVDIVLANAGISGRDYVFQDKSTADGDEPEMPDLSIFNINTVGVLYTAKLAVHYLPKSKGDKSLILTASLAGYLEIPGAPQYTASKFAVRGIMRSLRQTNGGASGGVRVNAIAPWYIETPIMSKAVIDTIASRGIPFAKKKDAAAAVVHLASDTSLNGRMISIVPREEHSRGYLDLGSLPEGDDLDPEGFLGKAAAKVNGTKHRIESK